MITYNLEKNGFSVMREATNGEDALMLLKNSYPALAIIDWMIPAPTGIGVCKILRRGKQFLAHNNFIERRRGRQSKRTEHKSHRLCHKTLQSSRTITESKFIIKKINFLSGKKDFEFMDISINLNQHKVLQKLKKNPLRPTEYKLLKHLMENSTSLF